MAELFKPEIGNVGGSNVTAYTPPSMDYSGIFNSLARTLNSFEKEKVAAPKLSEAEEKNQILEPYLSKAQRILSSDEIPEVKKYALVNGIKLDVARNYSAYRETFETALGTITKTLDPDGDPVQKEYEDMAKWGESENGTFARAQAFNLAITTEGEFDEGLYQSKIRELYYKDIQENNKLSVLKRQNEIDSANASLRFRNDFAPTLVNDISKDIETFSQGIAAKTILERLRQGPLAPGSQEAAAALLLANEVDMLEKRWKAEGTRRLVQAGFPVNDAAYNLDPFLIDIRNLKDALKNGGESVNTVLKSMNEQVSTAYIANMPPALRMAHEANKSTPPVIANTMAAAIMSIPENRVSIENYAKSFRMPTYDFSISMVGTGQTSSSNTLPVGADQSITSIQSSLPEFNPEMVPEVMSMNTTGKKELLKRTGIAIENAVVKDITQAEVQAKELSASYLSIATRLSGAAETGVTPLDQTRIFFGPKALNLVAEIQKKSPADGDALYLQINKTIQTETLRHSAALQSLLNNYFPNNPIILEVNDKNMVELKIDPAAKRDDPVFRRLASLDYKTDEEMLKGYQETYNLNPMMVKTIKDSMESLNMYLMAANRLPDNVKNSPDFAGIFIREQLSALPRFGGATVTAPVVP